MDPTLFAILESIFVKLATSAVGKALRDIAKDGPVDKAIKRVAGEYAGTYENVDGQLPSWLTNDDVGSIVDLFSRGEQPNQEQAATLVRAFIDAGFDDREATEHNAVVVLRSFFGSLHEELLRSAEGVLYSHQLLSGQNEEMLRAIAGIDTEIRRRLPAALPPQRELLPGPSVPAPLGDQPPEYALVQRLLSEGKANEVMGWLDVHWHTLGPASSNQAWYWWHANRGNALVQLNRHPEAEESFRRALELLPHRPNAIANVAYICLLRGRFQETRIYARQALDEDPNCEPALKILAQATLLLEGLDPALEVAGRLPPTPQRAHLEGALFLSAHRYDDALRELRRAYAGNPEDPTVQLDLARALLQTVQEASDAQGLTRWAVLPASLSQQLDEAEKLLDRSIHSHRSRSNPVELARALLTRAGLLDYRQNPAATTDYEEAGRALPDNAEVVANVARFHLRHRRLQEVVDTTSTLFRSSPDIALLRATALQGLGRSDESIAMLQDTTIDYDPVERAIALADLFIARREPAKAKEALEANEVDAEHWDVALRRAEILALTDGEAASISALQELVSSAPRLGQAKVRVLLGRKLMSASRWAEAAETMGTDITPDAPEWLIESYVVALHNADRFQDCLDFAKTVRERRGVHPAWTRTEARTLASLGHLNEARQLFEHLVAAVPRDTLLELDLAVTAHRLEDDASALAHLPTPVEAAQLETEDVKQVLGLCFALNQPMRAMETAYAFHIARPDDADSYMLFFGTFHNASQLLGDQLRATQVAPGTSVTIDVAGTRYVHKVLGEGDASEAGVVHAPHSAFAQRIIGKTIGDEVMIREDSLGREVGKIVDIRNRFVAVFQDILETFPQRFPTDTGLRRIPIDPDLTLLKKSVDAREARAAQLLEAYGANTIPISALARFSNTTDIEAWYFLIGSAPRLVSVSEDSVQFRAAQAAAQADGPLVLEATTICALDELGILDYLPRLGRPLLVARSTIDMLEQMILNTTQGVRLTVGKVGDQYVKQEVTADDELQHREGLERRKKWIQERCEVRGVTVPRGASYLEMAEMMTQPALDSMLLARESGGVLASEDLRLRSLARGEHQVDGTASFDLATAFHIKEFIDQEKLAECIVRLIRWHYVFMPIGRDVLLRAFAMDGNRPGGNLNTILGTLAYPEVNQSFTVGVIAAFIRAIWLEKLFAQIKDQTVVACLNALQRHPQWRPMLQALIVALRGQFALIPLGEGEVLRIVEQWLRLRGLA